MSKAQGFEHVRVPFFGSLKRNFDPGSAEGSEAGVERGLVQTNRKQKEKSDEAMLSDNNRLFLHRSQVSSIRIGVV